MNTPLNPGLRRRVAYLTLQGIMNDEQIMQALWMLEKRDQSADKLSFIGFVGVTAELMGINSSVVSSLYPKLNNNLSLPENELPADPMPQMLKFKGISGVQDPTKPVEEKKQQTDSMDRVQKKKNGNPEMVVFVAMISGLTSELGYRDSQSYSSFKEALAEQLHLCDLNNEHRAQLVQWSETLDLKAFKANFALNQVSKLFHCVYIATCEAEGPVSADNALNKAIQYASSLKVAKEFSPRNLL